MTFDRRVKYAQYTIALMASKRKGKGFLSSSSADETQFKDCSPEVSSIGEQVIVGQQLNNNEKLRFPATLVNAEETSDTEDGDNVSINNVHMPNSRTERDHSNMASVSGTPDIYQMMLQQQLMMQNLMLQQENPEMDKNIMKMNNLIRMIWT